MLDLVPLGDRAWLARFATEADARRWARRPAGGELPGVVDVVLAYKSASVHLDARGGRRSGGPSLAPRPPTRGEARRGGPARDDPRALRRRRICPRSRPRRA